MLEKPDLPEAQIMACLQQAYGLEVEQLTFLPLGADVNSAVYRAVAADQQAYFVKLRRGAFEAIGVTLPDFLHTQGIPQIIPPLRTRDGQLWSQVQDFRVILYPFIQGRSGFELVLSASQWADFGTALQRIHNLQLPQELAQVIPGENYTPQFREQVKRFLERVREEVFTESVMVKVAQLMQAEEAVIRDLIQRAEELAKVLMAQPNEFVLCHTDAHAGNLLIAESGVLYIVDWDAPVLAPKERDLMFIGGAQGFCGVTPQEEEMLFYRGYGETQIDQAALAYYRYERIIQDLAAFCAQLLDTTSGGEDREQSFGYLASNFLPGNTIEVARKADRSRLTS